MTQACKLNQVWQRVLFEAQSLKVACSARVEEIITQIIQTFLDNSLQVVLKQDELDEDEEENFEKTERTVRNDDIDFFSKLMKQKSEFSMALILDRYNQLIG